MTYGWPSNPQPEGKPDLPDRKRSFINSGFRFVLSNRRIAAVWVLLVALAGTAYFAEQLDKFYPLKTWFFWQLGTLWGWVLLFTLACSSFGQFLLVRVLRIRDLGKLESAVLGMASGVVAFTWGMYVAGALALYGAIFSLALPAMMIAVSAREGGAFALRVRRELAAPARRSSIATLAIIAGVLCVGVIYLGCLTPNALNYDSTWCHMTVAQDYAREHRIVAFPGDYNKNVPQLHSLIYTWGFLVPGLSPALRWMLALHNEFGLFLWTLVGTAAGVNTLLAGQAPRASWTVFFLFPGIFVYDSNLGGAADHVCAFFAVPILLALLRLCRSFRVADAALLAIVSAGALLTKYQAIYLIAPSVGIAGLHALWYLVGPRRTRLPVRQLALGLGVLFGLTALIASPHFLRNFIFYRNPVYPLLLDVFKESRPQVPNGAYYVEYIFKDHNFRPRGTTLENMKQAAKLWFSFSLEPHYSFARNVPIVGSLFTLLFPLLLFVRRRISIAAAFGSGALFVWGMTFFIDRNLQVLMPALACVTGALLIEGYRLGWVARAGLIPLICLQMVWGADAPFYGGADRVQDAITLIRSGFDGRAAERLNGYRASFLALGNALPPNAKVLLHETHPSLGINREIVMDWQGFQGLISYDPVRTPRELFDRFHELGITHLIQIPHERPVASKQEEVIWNIFVSVYAHREASFGGYEILSMPEQAPPSESPYRVAAFGLENYADGLYPIERMNANQHLPHDLQKYTPTSQPLSARADNLSSQLADVDAVFIGPSTQLAPQSTSLLEERFRDLASFGSSFTLYVRRDHAGSN